MSTEEQKEKEAGEGSQPEARSDEAGRNDAVRDTAASASESAEATTGESEIATADSSSEADDDEDGNDEPGASAVSPAKQAAQRASAGARLAAAKAAKSAKKAAKKAALQSEGGETPMPVGGGAPARAPEEVLRESPIGQAATKASEWASANRALALGIVGVLVAGALGWIGYSWWAASQAEAAGALLAEAVRAATAEIRAETEEPAEGEDEGAEDELTFPTRDARAESALERYRAVLAQYPGSDAGRWARLGQARALYDLGRMDEARSAYQGALDEAGGDPVVAWRAMEGIGFTYEAAQQWDEAISRYQELRSIENGAFEPVADYHIARMRMAKGETVEATTALRALVERLRATGAEGEEQGATPEFPYVLAQAEVRLRELDPNAARGSSEPSLGGGGLPPGLEGIDPALLEQLRRQLGAAGAGGGE